MLVFGSVDFALSAEDEAFRADLRAWIATELPALDREAPADHGGAEGYTQTLERARLWQRRMHRAGWAAPTWPAAWGGRDATVTQGMVYAEELARAKAPGLWNLNGIWHIGPTIIQWGTEQQKVQWIPPMLAADEHWCEGFSEPNAGSDLASLTTTARRVGDHYVLDGEKIWTSTAHLADWGLFLVRTDPSSLDRGAKHEGLTAIVVDMHADGIECSPIRDMSGDIMLNRVHLTGARVPVVNRLGGEDQGWKVAMSNLGFERVQIAGQAFAMRVTLAELVRHVRETRPEAFDDAVLRDRLARAWDEVEVTRLIAYRALSKVVRGESTWPDVQLAKLQWVDLSQGVFELAVDLLGLAGLVLFGGSAAVSHGIYPHYYLWYRYTSFGGGSTEIQKDIVANRALQLK